MGEKIAPTTGLASVVGQLAGTISHDMFPIGDRAQLRRMRPEVPPPAYWRLLFSKVPGEWRANEKQERNWGVIMQGMTIMAPRVHSIDAKPGRVLASLASEPDKPGNPMERRLTSLLNSQRVRLEDQIRLFARFLASKEQAVDWVSLALLLFTHDKSKREILCRSLARDFYMGGKTSKPESLD